jgi:formylglycine-generating enzyme required for sulfatase activity
VNGDFADQQPATVLTDDNPYVGPRAFTEAEAGRFYGREPEARDLLALVLRERLVLYFAQSGAGKSSLINARLIPSLREQGLHVLPVGRVSGALPAGADLAVDNVFITNLILSLNRGLPETQQAAVDDLIGIDLLTFLAGADPDASGLARTVLVVDQFEEIVTTHLDRWQDRKGFFEQLRDVLERLPNLWVVLTMREDYVASLEPYTELLPNRLRARFYMQRMSVPAALEAIKRPAGLYDRPFVTDVAEKLVGNLCQVRVSGQVEPQPGQYVEPVQLQVVCYQLWERLQSRPLGPITEADLPLDYVDQALTRFYEDSLTKVLADTAVHDASINERVLRNWFDMELITETGIRGIVPCNQETGFTGSLPNVAVDLLVRCYLLRTELRAGGVWVELVHDRFVQPILDANRSWFSRHEDLLTRVAQAWSDAGPDKAEASLYTGAQLKEARKQLGSHPDKYGELERQFLSASEDAERSRRTRRNQLVVAFAVALIVVFGILAGWAVANSRAAQKAAATAQVAQKVAAGALATNEAKLYALQTAQARPTELGPTSTPPTSTSEPQGAPTATPTPDLTATTLAEELAGIQATQTALAAPGYSRLILPVLPTNTPIPPSTPTPPVGATRVRGKDGAVMVYVPAGGFLMGSTDEDIDTVVAECGGCAREVFTSEQPQHVVYLDAFWIDRTEVTNAQFAAFLSAQGNQTEGGVTWLDQQSESCLIEGWSGQFQPKSGYDQHPVVEVTWYGANAYCAWAGKRLPTEAEWEYAARGPDGDIYPWGNDPPDCDRATYWGQDGGCVRGGTVVGSYPSGASPYGALDMAGNVWEWVADWYQDDYYAQLPGRNPPGPDSGTYRIVRGGSWSSFAWRARTAYRYDHLPNDSISLIGFRCVSPISTGSGL